MEDEKPYELIEDWVAEAHYQILPLVSLQIFIFGLTIANPKL